MPDPSTTRLALYKSKSDSSELVDYTQDLGQNWDKIDAAIGFAPCTSTTRPSTPYQGKGIMQTNTAYSTFVHNGTSPASGGWIEIPNSSSTFAGSLKLAAGQQLNIGGSASTLPLSVQVTSGNVLSVRASGDTQSRLLMDSNGLLLWGPGGSTTGDTNLYRGAANQLKTDDDLVVVGNLSAANITTGAEVAYTPVMSATSGFSLGNGTIKGSYVQVGKMVTCFGEVVFGTTTNTGTGTWSITAPFTAASGPSGASSNWGYVGSVRGHNGQWYAGAAVVLAGTNTLRFYEDKAVTEWRSDTPVSWPSNSSSYFHWAVSYMIP